MKILFALIIILSNYLFFTNGQPEDDGRLRPLNTNVVIRNFKPDRNPDFGLELSSGVVPGIMANTLGPNKRPQYGGSGAFLDPEGRLIVHNETTFNQWFNGDDICSNYLLTFPLTFDVWDPTVQIGSGGAFYPTDGVGFGNPIEFPEYSSDEFNQYYCFELHFSTIATDMDYDRFSFSTQGELWVYFDDQLVYDSGGEQSGFSGSVNLEYRYIDGLDFDGTTVHSIDLYTCYRSNEEYYGGVPLNFQSSANIFCSWIDLDGVCNGFNITAPCIDDPLSCVTKESICGNCILGLRQCPGDPTVCTLPKCFEGEGCTIANKTCPDIDVCTISHCDEELGCIGTPIPNCHCNSTNCITEDLCEPRQCFDEQCLAVPIDCKTVLLDCEEPFCNNGECFCKFNPGTTTGVEVPNPGSTTTGITTTLATTTSATITSATVTSATTTSATITSATITSATTTSGIETIGITSSHPKHDPTQCNESSCPYHYCCIQLKKAFTCVSKQFEQYCQPHRLSIFF